MRADCVNQLLVQRESGRGVRPRTIGVDVDDDDPVAIKAEVALRECGERPDEQTSADEEHQRHRHLERDE
jgi:hypothetical protein